MAVEVEENPRQELLDEESGGISYEVEDTAQNDHHFVVPVVPSAMQSTPTMALMALKLTAQPWNILGHGDDPNLAATMDMAISVERLTALFLIRIVALVSHRNYAKEDIPINAGMPNFSDTSTTNICTEALKRRKPWPKPFTSRFVHQLRSFVRTILQKYNDVHYHNFEHAYHVTISCNKLMDMMLMKLPSPEDVSTATAILNQSNTNSEKNNGDRRSVNFAHKGVRKTHGLKNDPLLTLAMLFSALVHDVEHKGVPNRQLVVESDELAILYNDQSVAEQRSLAVAFSELMRSEFEELRKVMFEDQDEYRRFRKTVINLVLSTDIASPERTQIVKSKWKEAFGDTQESKERKLRKEMSRRSAFGIKAGKVQQQEGSGRTSQTMPANFRPTPSMSNRLNYGNRAFKRRGSPGVFAISNGMGVSTASLVSDITMDPTGRRSSAGTFNTAGIESLDLIESEEDSASATPESADGLELVIEGDDSVNEDVVGSGTVASPSTSINTMNRLHSSVPEDEFNVMPGMSQNKSMEHDSSQLDRHAMMAAAVPPEMSRRFSLSDATGSSGSSGRYSIRLGIRRSLDLTGEQIENYSMSTRTFNTTPNGTLHNSKMDGLILGGDISHEVEYDPDEPDELKAELVMEHCLRAADIGPNLQGWEPMGKWSGRLFYELKSMHDADRGEDPQQNWFDNQITFLESYIMPLARRLDDTGVFGDVIGPMFAAICQQNRDRWITDGLSETAQVVQEWNMMREGDKLKMNGSNRFYVSEEKR